MQNCISASVKFRINRHLSMMMNSSNGKNLLNESERVDGSFAAQSVRKCWSNVASIDVEDLANFFGDNREQNNTHRTNTNPNHRVFRNRNATTSSTTVKNSINSHNDHRQFDNSSHVNENYYGCEYVGKCYQKCQEYGQRGSENRQEYTWHEQTDYERMKKINNFLPKCSADKLSFDVIGLPCTEEQWLACPAINCPIYDNVGNSAIASTHWPISSNQSGWNVNENLSYFGPVPPPCIVNETRDRIFNRDESYLPYYPQWDDEQQFFKDYLSNEKRKEKSRDAARCRRSRETDIFTELASALPLTPEQAAHLDKASVMRLAIAYLKVRSVIDALAEPFVKSTTLTEMDALFPKALDGFMLVLSGNGDMVYLSENVSDYLGVSQMDMMGQSVYEYSHPCDHDELRECLSMKPCDVKEKRPCNFFLRLKCTLTSKGRKVNLKSASYKVIHCTGRTMGNWEENVEKINSEAANSRGDDSSESSSSNENDMELGQRSVFGYTGASLVVFGCPIPHPSNIEVPLGRQTFLSKHSLNMKFTYADDRLAEYLGWSSNELLGKSVFEFHHALDNSSLDKSFKSLFSKGQCETMAYRFLGKTGGYAWVVTQATLIYCSKQHKPLSVVCVNHILSGVECEDEVYSERQLEARKAGVIIVNSIEDYETVESPNLLSLPPLVLETPSATNTDDSSDGTEDHQADAKKNREKSEERDVAKNAHVNNCAKESLILETKNGIAERARPLAVTATIFRSQAGLASQDSRKDLSANSFNAKVTKNPDNRRERANWYFQDKPILEYEPSRNSRPQAVTRNLFVPLGSLVDQELSQQQQHEQTANCRPPPQTTTASIFAPRTEDMNKGFLTFSEDQPGLTMLKDEPEDLTHLAPTPGDVCVPLEDTPFLSDMLDEFILSTENYCPLLSPEDLPTELPNNDLNDSLTKENNDIGESLESTLADSDPFIYRDIPSPCSLSPGLLSPAANIVAALGKSPDQSSIDSLQSPKHNIVDGMMTIGSGPIVGNPITEDEMLMLSINDVIGDDELALRAPYIPMSDQDEALQLLISDDTVMWGPTQPPDKKAKRHKGNEEKPLSKRYENSSLARLLKNDTGLVKHNDHGGGLVDPAQIFGQIATKGNNGSRSERPSKRVHGSLSPSVPTETKRSRFNDSRLPIDHSVTIDVTSVAKSLTKNYDEPSVDLCGILGTEEKIDIDTFKGQRGGSRLLLQQLMSRDHGQSTGIAKTRETTRKDEVNSSSIVTTDGATIKAPRAEESEKIGSSGNGGEIENSGTLQGQRGRRQSNSVLMNLLVSGCDKASSLKMPLQLSERWSPMILDETADGQLVPTKNPAELTFYNEYPSIGANETSCFANYFNEDSTDLPSRTNPSTITGPTVSEHRRYVK